MHSLLTPTTRIKRGEIHLWRVDAPRAAASFAALSAAERERADRRIGANREEFVGAHAAMRRLIAPYLGVKPDELALDCLDGEPPRLCGSEIAVSLSHRNGVALVALGLDAVGVDIEERPAFPADEAEDIAEFILSPTELLVFRRLPVSKRSLALAQAWNRKEACMKALASGFGDTSFAEIEITGGAQHLRAHVEGVTLHLADVETGTALIGAIASARAISEITIRDLTELA